MTLNKKLLASALVAGLAISANAQAAIILGVDDPLVYASEISDGTTLSDLNDDVTFDVGYNFSNGEVRYGRFECSSNMTLDNVALVETGGNVTLGAINGEGTSALFFSMTGNGVASEADTIAVDSDNTLEDGGDVTCAFSIYDQPSQAQAGGATGRIHTTGFATVITRASGFEFAMDPNGDTGAVANVEATDGAYYGFIPADWLFGTLEMHGEAGNFHFMAIPGVLDEDGAQIMLGDIFTWDTSFSIQGDISPWDPTTVCTPFVNYGYATCPDDIDSETNTATWRMGPQAFDGFLGVFGGAGAFQEGEFTATLNADAQPGYTVADVGPIHVGEITRNGAQLQAPLAQVPGAGWLSRMVLTNTGSADRLYEISVTGEAGNTIGTANTTGTVPANATVVVDLTEVMTSFTAGQQRRGTLNVTVAGPSNQIQGLYQIVNATSGSISNHVMVRPGTN